MENKESCSKLKKLCFQIAYALENCRFHNQILLIVLELIELSTLHFLYINPIYTHLRNAPILSAYFQDIYPYLYFIKQDDKQEFPVIIFTFSAILIASLITILARIRIG